MTDTKDTLLGELVAVVGTKHATADPTVLERYSRDPSFSPPHRPNYVVFPNSDSQVQELVRIANQHQIPVVPRSSAVGRRGGAIPAIGGIVIDLQRMNRIVELDRTNWLVTIEAGVTFAQLEAEIKKDGFRVAAPLLALPSASVVSTYVDREPLITAADFIYGNELVAVLAAVMPNGEPFTMGHPKRGNPPKAGTAPANIDGPGLNFYKLFLGSQGTMGIVTSMVLRVLPMPKEQRVLFMSFDELEPAIEVIQKIERREIGLECFALNDFNMAVFLLKESAVDAKKLSSGEYVGLDGAAPWSARQLTQFEALRKQLPPWTVVISLTGWGRIPKEKIAYQEEDLREVLAGSGIVPQSSLNGTMGVDELIARDLIAPTKMQKRFGYKGSAHGLCFYSEGEKAADFEDIISWVANKHRYPTTDIGGFVLPIERGRTFYCEYDLHCDLGDPANREAVKALFYDVSEALIDQGAFFDRPYGPWAEMMYSRVGAYTEYLKKLKRQLDPNGIMNPGKLCF